MQTLLNTNNNSYLNELNAVQQAAVTATNGPIMIIAGPGSGKTRVLTYRIAHLIQSGVLPYQILSLTFTNKAAREMRERIQKMVGETAAKQLYMGTFHAIFAKILRFEAEKIGYPTNFTIYDAADAQNLIKTIVKEMHLDEDLYKASIIAHRISSAKNNLLSPQAYAANPEIQRNDNNAKRPEITNIYKTYERRCKQAGAMDFDDLLLKMYQLLVQNPDCLQKYQHRFKYIHIDEFQDTNFVQYAIIKKLAGNQQNVCIVGDDAQSIYAFRGATIENILSFESEYPTLQIFKLEQNYRSSQNIVKIANEIINKNKRQLAKVIWTENDEGAKTKIIQAHTDNEEGRLVVDSIVEERLRNHFKNDDFVILYRTNAQSRIFEEALRKQGIAYRVYGGLSFYQRKEIKDFMAYLRLTINHNDEEALKRIINYPTRSIGDTTLQKMFAIANEQQRPVWEIVSNLPPYSLPAKTRDAINGFAKMIRNFNEMSAQLDAYELATYIGKISGIIKELHNDKTVEGLSRFENIQELLNSIKEYVENKKAGVVLNLDAPIDNDSSLGAYLQEVSLLTDLDNDKNAETAVKLMTIHSAKGLEFACVYVVGLEENLFPSKMADLKQSELEEERRLFYVATTRAEKKLTLSFACSRYRFGKLEAAQPSRFLQDIPENLINFVGGGLKSYEIPKTAAYNSFTENIKSNLNGIQKIKLQQSQAPNPLSEIRSDDLSKLSISQNVVHQRFGTGKVINIEGKGEQRIATIAFDLHGERRIMLKFTKLQIN